MSWPATCSMALKEWAAICRALESGRQTILLRKGGLADARAGFDVPCRHFWFYPTHFHETNQGTRPLEPVGSPGLAAWPAGNKVSSEDGLEEPTKPGRVSIHLFAEVVETRALLQEEQALALAGHHAWTEATIRQRFAYRRRGLWLMIVRVYRRASPWHVVETAAMAGCKSWVTLPEALPTTELTPVLDEAAFAQEVAAISDALRIHRE
jgi:hypothetical protein